MNLPALLRGRIVAACLLAFCVSACGTTPAPDFRGRWRAVNAMAETPQPIALSHGHAFSVTPIDRTLKALLERWSHDAGLRLDYRSSLDFTLHREAGNVRSEDLATALSSLEQAYEEQHLSLRIEARNLIVVLTP